MLKKDFAGTERNDMDRENRESMEEIHLRILRVTDDLRVIQRELNCAAMQAPTDPELMEALADPPQMEIIQVLKSTLDQMRHFLWFYLQVVTNDSEIGEKLRQTFRQETPAQVPEPEQQFQSANDAIMLRYLADSKYRKPN
jgi:Trm5-related predicted tRNA methylase